MDSNVMHAIYYVLSMMSINISKAASGEITRWQLYWMNSNAELDMFDLIQCYTKGILNKNPKYDS